ncbi:MAG: hypothetical protein SF051_14615 [Elusimicrobiota bacterium]|nr:hypothetical protein [Elusimicrobiota bacterium]
MNRAASRAAPLLAASLLLPAAPAAAQVLPPVKNLGLLMRAVGKLAALPFRRSLRLPEEGFAGALYREEEPGDFGDQQELHRFEAHAQRTGDDAGGWGGRYRYDSERHVGAEGFWTQYRRRGAEDLHYLHAVTRGDLWREEQWRVEHQAGVGALVGRLNRLGPRAGLAFESFPAKPWFLEGAAGGAFASGGVIGDLRAGAGVASGRLQLRLGWRVLAGPAWLSGPDAALTLRY